MSESVEDLVREFTKALNDISASTHLMLLGLRFMIDRTPEVHLRSVNQDPIAWIVDGTRTDFPNNNRLAEWRRSELITNIKPGGLVEVLAGQQWLVLTFALWEEHYRERIAKAANVKKDDVVSDVFGDLRLLRNDIVHNRGVARAGSSPKCKNLKWFEPGETIALTVQHYVEFRGELKTTFWIKTPPGVTN